MLSVVIQWSLQKVGCVPLYTCRKSLFGFQRLDFIWLISACIAHQPDKTGFTLCRFTWSGFGIHPITSVSVIKRLRLHVYRKIPKISPGAYIFQRPFLRGLFLEGLMFGGAWASLIVGRKFIVFALFYFVFEGNFQVQAPPGRGAYISRGDLKKGSLR